MPTPLLTAAEVAQLLKLNVETVYTLIAKHGLPASKIGGQWRFDEAKIRAWIESRSVMPGLSPEMPSQPQQDSQGSQSPDQGIRR
jgi:excisionase family DNA binding protein